MFNEPMMKWLRGRSAALRGARFLAYLIGMSRSLRAVRLASHPARSLHQRFWGRSVMLAWLVCVFAVNTVFAADDVAAMLKRADDYRLADAKSKVEMSVKLYEHGKLDKEKKYTVYVKPGRRSLVLFRSAGEAGQKVLMLDDAFWMLMPGTHRPIRITPMQKLLGEASAGDVTTLTWSEDYTGKLIEAKYKGEHCKVTCKQLELTSARKGTSYQRIELWLDKHDVPLYARLYLRSGRLAKEASYKLGKINGKQRITTMTLFDSINTSKRTEIEYLSVQAADVPDKFYNPTYLMRENLEGW